MLGCPVTLLHYLQGHVGHCSSGTLDLAVLAGPVAWQLQRRFLRFYLKKSASAATILPDTS